MSLADYSAALDMLEGFGGAEPDPTGFGVWVPGIPVLAGNGLDAANAAPWLSGLINNGVVSGAGAVLGLVPQMLVLFLLLAFLEACGDMSRIAFVLDRVFRRFGLFGGSGGFRREWSQGLDSGRKACYHRSVNRSGAFAARRPDAPGTAGAPGNVRRKDPPEGRR